MIDVTMKPADAQVHQISKQNSASAQASSHDRKLSQYPDRPLPCTPPLPSLRSWHERPNFSLLQEEAGNYDDSPDVLFDGEQNPNDLFCPMSRLLADKSAQERLVQNVARSSNTNHHRRVVQRRNRTTISRGPFSGHLTPIIEETTSASELVTDEVVLARSHNTSTLSDSRPDVYQIISRKVLAERSINIASDQVIAPSRLYRLERKTEPSLDYMPIPDVDSDMTQASHSNICFSSFPSSLKFAKSRPTATSMLSHSLYRTIMRLLPLPILWKTCRRVCRIWRDICEGIVFNPEYVSRFCIRHLRLVQLVDNTRKLRKMRSLIGNLLTDSFCTGTCVSSSGRRVTLKFEATHTLQNARLHVGDLCENRVWFRAGNRWATTSRNQTDLDNLSITMDMGKIFTMLFV